MKRSSCLKKIPAIPNKSRLVDNLITAQPVFFMTSMLNDCPYSHQTPNKSSNDPYAKFSFLT